MAPYTEWEDWQRGMYRDIPRSQAESFIADAEALLGSPLKLAAAMRDVTIRWPTACDVHLRHEPNNRAWLGQAACCLSCDVPEELTRQAWCRLTEAQQGAANKVADAIIAEWKFRKRRRSQLEFVYA